jgi:hypothetical protein
LAKEKRQVQCARGNPAFAFGSFHVVPSSPTVGAGRIVDKGCSPGG